MKEMLECMVFNTDHDLSSSVEIGKRNNQLLNLKQMLALTQASIAFSVLK
jgi:hypothetical protein